MDLFEIVGKLSIDGVDKAEKDLDGVSGKGSKVASVMKGVGAGVLAVTGAVATGSVALIKSVSSSYGELQQSIGGIETLFGESAGKVIENANNAFKTAGLSANDYMQQVTSFSASLLQAVGGDTEKACASADMAIIDMSDNANKMGTSMEAITNAYQGFAKQNYTMLDNLKLGYGGTKGEMERLLADAEAISGVHYDINNLNDVYNAIHIIQTELGITGTTAKESGETIQGSFGSLSASWENFIAGLGNPDADMKLLVENLANSISGAVSNVTPIIDNMVAVLPTVMDALINTISTMLPTLIETFTQLITKVLDAIVQLLPQFIPLAVDCILTVVDALVQNLPLIMDAGVLLIVSLIGGIGSALPTLIPAIVNAVVLMAETLLDNIDLIIDGAIALVLGLAEGLITALPQLIEKIPVIIDKLIDAIINNLPKILEMGVQLLGQLTLGIIKAIPSLLMAIPQIIMSLVNGFWGYQANMRNIGLDLVKGLWNGITSAGSWLRDKISGFANNILNNFKKAFGINSPSRLLRDEIGVFLGEGIGVGIEKDTSAEESIKNKVASVVDIANNSLSGINVSGVDNLIGASPMQQYKVSLEAQIGALNDGFDRLIALVGAYLPTISENSSKQLIVDGNSLVMGISRQMDFQLGKIATAKGRGNI